MAKEQRNRLIGVSLLVTVLALGGWFVLSNLTVAPAHGDDPVGEGEGGGEPAAALSAADHSAVDALRERLTLRNEDLAAMGCTRREAGGLLRGVRGWYESKRSEISAARAARVTASEALRAAMRRVRIGPRDEELMGQLPTLQAAVATAATTERTLWTSARTTMAREMTASQKAVWDRLRANRGLPGAFRYVSDLTARQRRSLKLALRSRGRALAAARTSAQRNQVETAFRSAVGELLSGGQRSTMAATSAGVRQRVAGVIAASGEELSGADR